MIISKFTIKLVEKLFSGKFVHAQYDMFTVSKVSLHVFIKQWYNLRSSLLAYYSTTKHIDERNSIIY